MSSWDEIATIPARVADRTASTSTTVLSHVLAGAGEIAHLRVVWVRRRDAGDEPARVMTTVRDAILRTMPQGLAKRIFVDLVVPSSATESRAAPNAVQAWRQYVLSPEDRPSPSGADAVLTPEKAEGQGLHAALLLGGVLGGASVDDELPGKQLRGQVWVVHPFTRLVLGGDRVRRVVEGYVRGNLQALTAADVAPASYVLAEPEEADAVVDGAAEWARSLDEGALRLELPVAELEAPGRWRIGRFLVNVLRFSVWALQAMLGSRAIAAWLQALWARLMRRIESIDLGVGLVQATEPYRYHLTDWAAVEARSASDARTAFDAQQREDGELPPAGVWTRLIELSFGTIDGSRLPGGWVPDEHFGRKVVLPADRVFRGETADATAMPGPSSSPSLRSALRPVKWIGAGELSAALQHAAHRLRSESIAFGAVGDSQVSRAARAIIGATAARDAALRTDQADRIAADSKAEPAARALLPRLRAKVLGDLVTASMTADRLIEPPEFPPEAVVPSMERIIRRTARDALITIASFTVALVLILVFRDELQPVLEVYVPFIGGWPGLLTTLGIAAAVALLTRLFLLFRAWRAYNEIGERRVEHVTRRGEAAVLALHSRNRLRNADRILARLEDVLSSLYRVELGDPPPHPEVPSGLPASLRIAELALDDERIAELAAEHGVELGWWEQAYLALERGADLPKTDAELWRDDGLQGGAIEELHEAALDGKIVTEAWSTWIDERVSKIVTRVADRNALIDPVGELGGGRRTIRELAAELDELDRYQAGRAFEGAMGRAADVIGYKVAGGPGAHAIRTTASVAFVVTGLSLRPFGRPARARDAADSDEESDWGA